MSFPDTTPSLEQVAQDVVRRATNRGHYPLSLRWVSPEWVHQDRSDRDRLRVQCECCHAEGIVIGQGSFFRSTIGTLDYPCPGTFLLAEKVPDGTR